MAPDDDDRERHIERQRGIKIGKIVPAMRRRGISSSVAESYTEAQWDAIAAVAGVNTPSVTTRRRIIRILMTTLQLDRIAS